MYTRLNALQITQFWDVIKFAIIQTAAQGYVITEEDLNSMFASLMCDKSQCIIKYKDDEIWAIMITEIIEHLVTKKTYMNIKSFYAFKPFDVEEWLRGFELVKTVAKADKCDSIVFESLHPALLKMSKGLGFNKKAVIMEYSLEA